VAASKEKGLLAYGSLAHTPVIHVAWDAPAPLMPLHDRVDGVAELHSTV
jgi:hypothetical protein